MPEFAIRRAVWSEDAPHLQEVRHEVFVREQGVPRIVLWTAAANPRARALFESEGFRPTMVEMTKEV